MANPTVGNEGLYDPAPYSRYSERREGSDRAEALDTSSDNMPATMPEDGISLVEGVVANNFSISGPVVRPGVVSKNGGGGEADESTRLLEEIEERERISPDTGSNEFNERLRKSPLWGVVANNIVFMAVPLSMPSTFANAGWIFGSLFLLYSCVITYETGIILGEIYKENPSLGSYPLMAEAAFELLPEHLKQYTGIEICKDKCKSWGRNAIMVMQFATYFLTNVAEMIYFEQFLGQLFDGAMICQWKWLLVVFAVTIPVSQIPNFSEARWMAIPAGLVLVLNTYVFFYEVYVVKPWDCNPGPRYNGVTVSSVFNAFNNFGYLFGGHGLYPEELREMKDANQWGLVMKWTYSIVMPLYGLFGYLGYFAYGDFALANLNLNFPKNAINMFSISIALIQEIYLVFFTNMVLFLQVELWFGVDPTSFWKGGRYGLPPVLFRLIWRSALVGLQMFIAQILLSGEGDTIFALQSLVGAVGMTAFTYFLPLLFFNLLLGNRISRRRRYWHIINFFLGVVIMFGGLYYSLHDLLGRAGGIFNGLCYLEYTYSPENPDDPCHGNR